MGEKKGTGEVNLWGSCASGLAPQEGEENLLRGRRTCIGVLGEKPTLNSRESAQRGRRWGDSPRGGGNCDFSEKKVAFSYRDNSKLVLTLPFFRVRRSR